GAERAGPAYRTGPQPPGQLVVAEAPGHAAGPAQHRRVGEPLDRVEVAGGEARPRSGTDPAGGPEQPRQHLLGLAAGPRELRERLGDLGVRVSRLRVERR